MGTFLERIAAWLGRRAIVVREQLPFVPQWISVVRFTGDASKDYWRITDTEYLEDDGANCNVYAIAFNEKGLPAFNSKAEQRFPSWDHPDERILLPFTMNGVGQASASFNMNGDGSSFDPGKNQVGPQSLAMFGNSDRIDGIGLPLRRHVTLTVTFQFTKGSATPPPPPAPPPTGDYVTRAELAALKQSLIDALR